ncbi:MAG: M16 family metallopeptidase [Alphaproteobacteria bacterium]
MDEPLGKGGEAHLLEHLMFRGTRKIKGNRFNEIMEANGAESNAFTSTDMTAYHQGLDISRLELAMFLEADRMQNLKISDKDFALERDIVFQERKQRIDNNPAAYFGEVFAPQPVAGPSVCPSGNRYAGRNFSVDQRRR